MKLARRTVLLACVLPFLSFAEQSLTLTLRGKTQTVAFLPSPAKHEKAILFLPGDGGWRGLAITIAQQISKWGYDVYGLDTKDYLTSFSQNGAKLKPEEVQADLLEAVSWIESRGAKRVVLVGWSQGASMAALATALHKRKPLHGVLTLGLPETGVLGWSWKDTLAVIARREPDQPQFQVAPALAQSGRTPIWMIHGTNDEYTSAAKERELFAKTQEPKKLIEVPEANHHFDGRRDELFKALREGLEWIETVATAQ
jgi:type IV secretory pathway VirJ component